MIAYSWSCACCGKQHQELPTCSSFGPPASYQAFCAVEAAERAVLTNDVCSIDDAHWFIRGNIDIPIVGTDERFVFTVWSSLSDARMRIVEDTWDDPDRSATGPFFGWLNTEVVPYPGTLNLPVEVHIEPPGIVPSIVLRAGTHPLADVQRDGIGIDRVIEIAEALLPRY